MRLLPALLASTLLVSPAYAQRITGAQTRLFTSPVLTCPYNQLDPGCLGAATHVSVPPSSSDNNFAADSAQSGQLPGTSSGGYATALALRTVNLHLHGTNN